MGGVLSPHTVPLRKGSGRCGLLWLFQLLQGSHPVVAPQTILLLVPSWSLGVVSRTLGDDHGLPRTSSCPSPFTPYISCDQGLITTAAQGP